MSDSEDDRSGSGSNKDSDEEEENQSSQEGSGSGSDEEGSNEDGSEDEEKSGNSDEEEEKDDEEQKVQDTKTSNKDDKSKQHVIDDDEEFKVTLKDQAFDFRKRQNIFDILNEINNDLDQLTVQVDSICQKYVPSLRQSTLKKQPSMNYYKSQSLIENRDDFMKNKQRETDTFGRQQSHQNFLKQEIGTQATLQKNEEIQTSAMIQNTDLSRRSSKMSQSSKQNNRPSSAKHNFKYDNPAYQNQQQQQYEQLPLLTQHSNQQQYQTTQQVQMQKNLPPPNRFTNNPSTGMKYPTYNQIYGNQQPPMTSYTQFYRNQSALQQPVNYQQFYQQQQHLQQNQYIMNQSQPIQNHLPIIQSGMNTQRPLQNQKSVTSVQGAINTLLK